MKQETTKSQMYTDTLYICILNQLNNIALSYSSLYLKGKHWKDKNEQRSKRRDSKQVNANTSWYTLTLAGVLLLLLLVLLSQLYLWVSPLWGNEEGEIFAYVTIFFNPSIEIVTFCFRGWSTLSVYLLPAFTHLGHECQYLLGLCDALHVRTDLTSVYTLIRKSL